jgi:pimeloyl-ACP methyl ester carboxylesterase
VHRNPELRFGYADGPFGQLHYVESGTGPPLLCLHQAPRSWDEYAELIPLLRARLRVVALDTPGMGASAAPPPGGATIEAYADAAVALLDHLGLARTSVLGHHTGGVIALDLAARHPDRVDRLILSSTAWVDAAARERRRSRPPIDAVEPAEDGTHLVELWRRRRAFYPAERPDVLERFVHDALAARDAEEGHLAVGRYRMEDRISAVRAPTLCLGASADPFAFPELQPLASRIRGATTAVIEGGTVGLLEDKASEVAELVLAFLVGTPR